MTPSLAGLDACFEGVVPSILCSLAPDGTPNVSYLSHVVRLGEAQLDAAFPGRVVAAQAQAQAQNHAQILSQVEALELAQARSIREAFLTGDKTRLAQIEHQIATLMGRAPVVQ